MLNEKAFNKLNTSKKRYDEIQQQLVTIDTSSDFKKIAKLQKEQSLLSDKNDAFAKYEQLVNDISELKEIISSETDSEMISEFKTQQKESEKALSKLEEDITELLIDRDPMDANDCVFEIKGAAGGDEANIFVGDLYTMYTKYAESQNLKIEILDAEETAHNGFKHLNMIIRGIGAYGLFKFESGVHRVQRVPATETAGRVHTSTATVATFPELEEEDIAISPTDIRIDTYRSGGKGGQHANKTDSAVRITHLPSGIVAQSQEGRSQHHNRDLAMTILRSRVFDLQQQTKMKDFNQQRKLAVGTGERSEKIRTYNYPQNRVTDHRIGLTIKKLDRIMTGDLDEIVKSLNSFENE
ncbi:MAG: peptide chain release factor 1 [Tenericutes bacterium]|nr:MAG: peptide chain release factor 1 [Mycoplasmatota bacterium]